MKKTILYIIILILVFLAGIWVAKSMFIDQKQAVEEATILEQQIKKVCKLVTVEGNYVEYYDYGDPKDEPYFVGPFINFSAFLPDKSARMRIKAKVMVGYDLERLVVSANSDTKVIRIGNIPEPDILSIEHDLEYFDKDDYWINALTDDDYVKMNRGAKEKIRQAAEGGDLIKAAKEQGNEVMSIIEFIANGAGYEVELVEVSPSINELDLR